MACCSVNTFCCGRASLQTGAKIVGLIGILLGLMSFLFYIDQARLEMLGIQIPHLLLSLYLLYGAADRNPTHVRAWLIFAAIEVVVLVILAIVLIAHCVSPSAVGEQYREPSLGLHPSVAWTLAIMLLLTSSTYMYLSIFIMAFIRELKSGNEGKVPNSPPITVNIRHI